MKSAKMFKKGLLSVAVVTAMSAYACAEDKAVTTTDSQDVTAAPKPAAPQCGCHGSCCADCMTTDEATTAAAVEDKATKAVTEETEETETEAK